jgi:hypothetical protein
MRTLFLPFAAWISALQLGASPTLANDLPRLIAVAGVLGSLTVLVYRLGVWRQEMVNTKDNASAEVRSHREGSASNFARVERQLEAHDHVLTDYMEFKRRVRRWRHHTEQRLERLEELFK